MVGGGLVGRCGAGGLRVGFWSLRGRNEDGEQGGMIVRSVENRTAGKIITSWDQ